MNQQIYKSNTIRLLGFSFEHKWHLSSEKFGNEFSTVINGIEITLINEIFARTTR